MLINRESSRGILSSLKVTYAWLVVFAVIFASTFLLPALLEPTTVRYELEFNQPEDAGIKLQILKSRLTELDERLNLRTPSFETEPEAQYAVVWLQERRANEAGVDNLELAVREILRDNNLEWNRGLVVNLITSPQNERPPRTLSPFVWSTLAIVLLVFFFWQQRFKETIRRPKSRALNYRSLLAALVTGTLLAPLIGFLVGWSSSGGSGFNHVNTSTEDWLLLFSLIILIPIAEEVVFRAWFLERLAQVLKPTVALLISAIAFSAIHPIGLIENVILVIPGLLWGYFWLRYRSLVICILAHSAYNATVVGIVILQQV